MGFSNFRNNGFNPSYNYYKKDNKIIIRIEAPGNISIKSDIKYEDKFTIIEIIGKKEKDIEPKNDEDNIFNGREFGNFSIHIPLLSNIANKSPNIIAKNGVLIVEYELQEEKPKVYKFELDEEI